ncbi:DUF1761 domain-containing protein [Hirschia litorea]|uniref:DUF1761 domain-containing protein n=1 Tax=Hirschia litorea TaxID=1199156 RepID=A0ABW2IGG1_9PROT
MPRIGGINVVGVLLATIAFYMVGFVFYGLVFQAEWTAQTLAMSGVADLDSIRQMTPERLESAWYEAFPDANPGLSMGLGFVTTLITVTVLAIILRQLTSGASTIMSYAGLACLLAIGFSVTTLAYDHIYAAKPLTLLWIDSGHLIIGYVISAVILSFFD